MIRVVGIDPGKVTGLALVVDGELTLRSLDFWGAHGFVFNYDPREVDLVVVEVHPASKVWHDHGGNARKAGKIGQNVGAVRDQGELLAEGFRRAGYQVREIQPLGKLDHTRFQAYTGYRGRTNEHTRDAGIMAIREYERLKQLARVQA